MELGSVNMSILHVLHEKINKILPIDGIASFGGGVYRVDYINQPSPEQQVMIDNIISGFPLDEAKLEKLGQVNTDWATTIQNGWSTPSGWKLGIDISDVTLLTGAFILSKELDAAGINHPVSIIDLDGEAHIFTTQELTVLMLEYGNARATISNEYAAKKRAINNALTLEELQAL